MGQEVEARLKDQADRIKDLISECSSLKKQLADKAAEVNELQERLQNVPSKDRSQSSAYDQLETENMELLAKLAKTEKELQEMRSNANQKDDLDLSRTKMDEAQEKKFADLQLKVHEVGMKILKAKEEVVQACKTDFAAQVDSMKERLASFFAGKAVSPPLESDGVREVKAVAINEKRYICFMQDVDP